LIGPPILCGLCKEKPHAASEAHVFIRARLADWRA